MRFMVMVKATKSSEAGVMPDAKLLGDMMKFNEELVKAGIMQAGEEAMAWAKRCPSPFPGEECEIEIRPLYEAEDFGEEFTPEMRAQEERLRAQVAKAK